MISLKNLCGSEQDWQVMCVELKQRGSHLLRTGLWSDCSFIVGPEQVVITAHRLILAMASPVFEAMFYGTMAETKNSITIPDDQPEAFRSLLVYIYSDEIKITSISDACDLLCVANKYMLLRVVKACNEYISSNMVPSDACRVYELACLFKEAELMENALKVMSANTLEVLSSKCFEEAKLSTVVRLFSLDNLNMGSELDLLDAAERYVQAHEDTAQKTERPEKMLIRQAVQQIRFLTLAANQFTRRKTALLTDTERIAIIDNISSKDSRLSMQKLSTSREVRTRSRCVITIRMTVGTSTLDSKAHLSEVFYLRDLAWRIVVKRDIRSERVFLEVSLAKVSQSSFSLSQTNWSCIAVVETIVPKLNDTGSVVKLLAGPKQFNCNNQSSLLNVVALTENGLNRDDALTLELRVRTFTSLDIANRAVYAWNKRLRDPA